jgi:hypothetical protein
MSRGILIWLEQTQPQNPIEPGNFIVHNGTRVVGSHFPSEERNIEIESEERPTLYFTIREEVYQYLQRYDLAAISGLFLDIIPTFDYCNYLVEFGKELFGRLYEDLEPINP